MISITWKQLFILTKYTYRDYDSCVNVMKYDVAAVDDELFDDETIFNGKKRSVAF